MLSARWYSVCNDLGTYLGDVMIERIPTVRWEFFTPSDSGLIQYQKPVVYGFTLGERTVDDELAFDLIGTCVQIGQRVILGEPLLDRNKRFMLHELELAERYA
ncbi:hypothetical protein AXK61_13680 [Tsukamurella pseudospumae]|nr:hypothetical protein AXK61_13680 [Tsukamurella pseudospumae]